MVALTKDFDFRPLLKSTEVMKFFGYTNSTSFWQFVRSSGVPHVRLNARRLMFEPQALNDWVKHRSSRGV
jgi:hypothetical protein